MIEAVQTRAHTRGAAQAAADIQRAYPGAHVTFDYQPNWIPGVLNDPTVVGRASGDLSAAIGADHLVTVHQIAPGFSEDFGRMQAIVPEAMFFLGVSNASRGWVGLPHSPNYMADEEAIFVGSKAMARVLLDFMRTK
jgi:metal-dependent amidase/aminoacylase/carboxypeptidase family protein